MITFTKEQLIASAHARIEFAEMMLAGELEPLKERTWLIELELARIALASLEAEAVCVIDQSNLDYLKSGSDADVWPASRAEMGDVLLYRSATPAPVSVPDEVTAEDCPAFVKYDVTDVDEAWARGFNACRAAMLQGAEQQNRQQNIPENIPATQFKPVADLYGLTSPTGSETSFTFDAVEARDFIDGGWSCQEYVELERFQEAITNHTEDKLAMVDHSGDSNNMVEPVTTAYKLPPHIFRELVNRLRDTAVKYQGCQQLREQLSRTLQEVIQPAAPQQEVESQIRKGKTVAREEWELGARLTKHRFKP
ncbi:hypothetical protein [Citrobacter freundii]|uniref:hypothetical protein n=1 Tax=Citrobacter freundii TaxID=546 RepID=UPI00301C378A